MSVVEQEVDAVLLGLDGVVVRARANHLEFDHTQLVSPWCACIGKAGAYLAFMRGASVEPRVFR